MTKDCIHTGHRQRLRNLSNNVGLENMPEHQVLELILSYIIPQKDTNPIAHALLKEFGSISNVFEASITSLTKVKGIGTVAAEFLHLCSQIPLVYKRSKIATKQVLDRPSTVIKYYKDIIQVVDTEKFYVTYLNAKCELIKTENLGSGSTSKIVVNIKELLQNILKLPTTGIILCHTHPNGEAKPSLEDVQFTRQVMICLKTAGLKLLDHIILSHNDSYSFLNSGELSKYESELDNLLQKVDYVAQFEKPFVKD